MTEEQVLQRIKEILAKDTQFKNVSVKINLNRKDKKKKKAWKNT